MKAENFFNENLIKTSEPFMPSFTVNEKNQILRLGEVYSLHFGKRNLLILKEK